MKPANEIRKDIRRKDADPAKGWSSMSLCIAKIVEIHWEEMRCTLQVIHGQGDVGKPLSGVELAMPSMGNRHFMGGIPEIGDQCIVGWFASDTLAASNDKTPAILAWWPRATYLGHDWLTTQSFQPGEGIDTNKKRQAVESYHQRIRHKLRHYEPGNVAASSSQGADLVLNESVLLSNRRSNEIALRDQDQAIIMRSLQQFHAMSGARVYAGMVQRDARNLPKEMFSDGIKWDSGIQIDSEGKPFYPLAEEYEKNISVGKLTPHPLFDRGESATYEDGKITGNRNFEGKIPPSLDPYRFLYKAGLVSEDFYGNTNEEAITYGGKSIFRVSKEGGNAVESGSAFTEYRIEVNHTSDGTLPVTEQTDGFDSDRCPKELEKPRNMPFIEWVLGTPTGNNPFTTAGASLYGIPLIPVVENTKGKIEGANSSTSFADHSAALLRITPVAPAGIADTFSSFTKGGKYRGFVSNPSDDSAKLSVAGGFSLNANKGEVRTITSLDLASEGSTSISSSVIKIEGTESRTGNEVAGAGSEVSVEVIGNKRIQLESGSAISLKAPLVDLSQAGEVRLNSKELMSLSTGTSLNMSSERIKQTAVGSLDVSVSGPPNANALHGAVRKVKIIANPGTGHPAGPSDSYTNVYGGKEEVFLGPSTNTKTLTTGTESKTIGVGSDTTIVSGSTQNTDATGFKFLSPQGSVVVSSGLKISMSSANVSIVSGSVSVKAPSISLSSPGTAIGGIVCGSDIDPLFGVPMSTLIAPRGQNLSNV